MAEHDPFILDTPGLTPEERLIQRRALHAIDREAAARTRLAFYREGMDNTYIEVDAQTEVREKVHHLLGVSAIRLLNELDPELIHAQMMRVRSQEEYDGYVDFMPQRLTRFVETDLIGWPLNGCDPLPYTYPHLGRDGVVYAITPDSKYVMDPLNIDELTIPQVLEIESGVLHEVHSFEGLQ